MSTLTASRLAPGLLLGPDVRLGENVTLGAYVVIHAGTVIGNGCTIQDGAVLGKPSLLGPRSRAPASIPGPLVLEAGASVCCGAVISASAHIGSGAVIGDHTFLRAGARIGTDTVVGHGSAIGGGVRIGDRVKLQNSVIIAPGSLLEDDVFFGPLVVVTNDLTMGRHTPAGSPTGVTARRACRVGASAVLFPGVEIGAEAVVGAGSLVPGDVASRAVVIGSPARHVRDVSEDELDRALPGLRPLALGDAEEPFEAGLVALGDAPALGVIAGGFQLAFGLSQPLTQVADVHLVGRIRLLHQ